MNGSVIINVDPKAGINIGILLDLTIPYVS